MKYPKAYPFWRAVKKKLQLKPIKARLKDDGKYVLRHKASGKYVRYCSTNGDMLLGTLEHADRLSKKQVLLELYYELTISSFEVIPA